MLEIENMSIKIDHEDDGVRVMRITGMLRKSALDAALEAEAKQ